MDGSGDMLLPILKEEWFQTAEKLLWAENLKVISSIQSSNLKKSRLNFMKLQNDKLAQGQNGT